MSVEMSVDPRFWDKNGSYVKVSVFGNTVRDCLKQLVEQEPVLREKLFNNEGDLNPAVLVFQNDKTVFPYNLATSVTDGDEVKVIFGGGT
jgi:molybdopterin converting factor small subunit